MGKAIPQRLSSRYFAFPTVWRIIRDDLRVTAEHKKVDCGRRCSCSSCGFASAESGFALRSISLPLFLQRWAKVDAPVLVNFVPAVAHHFCLNLPAAFSQPGASNLANLCTSPFPPHFKKESTVVPLFNPENYLTVRPACICG